MRSAILRGVIRLVCIDVDGTLIGSSGDVLPANWAAAEKARARGIRLALCSGRPAFGISRSYAERLDPEGWHVFQNGASVVHLPTGKSRSAAFPAGTLAALIARARRTGHILELYTDTEYAAERDTDPSRRHAALLGIPYQPRSFDSLTGTIVRAQWLVLHDEVSAMLGEPHPDIEAIPSTSPLMPETIFINMTAAGVGKASAVKTIAAAYGIPLEEVMMVGDGLNDLTALRTVGFPVAMDNAEPQVKAAARLHVGHVDKAGLAEALELALTAG